MTPSILSSNINSPLCYSLDLSTTMSQVKSWFQSYQLYFWVKFFIGCLVDVDFSVYYHFRPPPDTKFIIFSIFKQHLIIFSKQHQFQVHHVRQVKSWCKNYQLCYQVMYVWLVSNFCLLFQCATIWSIFDKYSIIFPVQYQFLVYHISQVQAQYQTYKPFLSAICLGWYHLILRLLCALFLERCHHWKKNSMFPILLTLFLSSIFFGSVHLFFVV